MRTPTMTRIVARTGRSTLSGTRALRWLPKKMPGRKPMSKPSNPIDRSQKPVADARDQGQRHGMGDVGADETGDRGARVEQNESCHPDSTGTDRGERHENAEQEPGEGRQCRGPPRMRLRMPRRGQQTQPPMRQDTDRSHDKGDAQSGGDQGRRGVALDAQDVEREETQDCWRDAAACEPAGDAPVHRSCPCARASRSNAARRGPRRRAVAQIAGSGRAIRRSNRLA
jgi:hypothetical protein